MNKSNVVNFLITLRCLGYAAVVLAILAVTAMIIANVAWGGSVDGGWAAALPWAASMGLPGVFLAMLSRLTEFFVRRARFEPVDVVPPHT